MKNLVNNKLKQSDQTIITSEETHWLRAIETDELLYFCDFTGYGDDNTSTLMFKKSDLSLVSDNYFATNDLVGVIESKSYSWISKEAEFNFYTLANLSR